MKMYLHALIKLVLS